MACAPPGLLLSKPPKAFGLLLWPKPGIPVVSAAPVLAWGELPAEPDAGFPKGEGDVVAGPPKDFLIPRLAKPPLPAPAGPALLAWSEAAGPRQKVVWAWPALEKVAKGASGLAELPPRASENAACDFATSAF